MLGAYALKPDQTVWIFQAGWDIALARALPEKIPEFHDLKSENFGRNISLIKLTATPLLGAAVSQSKPQATIGSARIRFFVAA